MWCRFELRLLGALAPGEEAAISYGESKPNPEVRQIRQMLCYSCRTTCAANHTLPPRAYVRVLRMCSGIRSFRSAVDS